MTRTLMRYFGSHCNHINFKNFSRRKVVTYASKPVKDIDKISGVEVINGTLSINFKSVFVHLDVDAPPPDLVLAGLFINDTLVLWAPSSLLAREIDESSRGGDDSSFVSDGIFIELSGRGIALQVDFRHVEAGLREVLEVTPDN